MEYTLPVEIPVKPPPVCLLPFPSISPAFFSETPPNSSSHQGLVRQTPNSGPLLGLHGCFPSTQEAKAGGSCVQGQPEIHSKALSQKP